jgi:hypothetical protein
MVVMLVLLQLFGKLFNGYRFFGSVDLCFSPVEYLFCLDAVVCIFNELPVLHHTIDVVSNPRLFFATARHAHVAEQLIFGECLQVFRSYFNVVVTNEFVDDQRPLKLVGKCGELMFCFFGRLWFFSTLLYPAFQECLGKLDLGMIQQYVVQLMLQMVAALFVPV